MSTQQQKASSGRVVLGSRQKGMVAFRWSGKEPPAMSDVETAEELVEQWEGDELVVYDHPGFTQLFEYYESGEHLPDND